MYLRQQSVIRLFEWSLLGSLDFADEEKRISVRLQRPSQEERERWNTENLAISCITTGQRDTPQDIESAFRYFHRDDHSPTVLDGSDKTGWKNYVAITQCVADIFTEFQRYATQVMSTLRWRNGALRGHNDLLHIRQYWSFNGEDWQSMPQVAAYSTLSDSAVPGVSDEVRQSVETHVFRVSSPTNEPLAHELFREAYAQRDVNPRSALLIGITAAEVGIKNCISTLVPDATWLAFEAPSPPIFRMLRDYIPILPMGLKQENGVLIPPQHLVTALRRGVELRNDVTHRGEEIPDRASLDQILDSIRDILYLLDYYCGHEWALQQLGNKSRQALGLPLKTADQDG